MLKYHGLEGLSYAETWVSWIAQWTDQRHHQRLVLFSRHVPGLSQWEAGIQVIMCNQQDTMLVCLCSGLRWPSSPLISGSSWRCQHFSIHLSGTWSSLMITTMIMNIMFRKYLKPICVAQKATQLIFQNFLKYSCGDWKMMHIFHSYILQAVFIGKSYIFIVQKTRLVWASMGPSGGRGYIEIHV